MNRSRWCCVGVVALVFLAGLGALASSADSIEELFDDLRRRSLGESSELAELEEALTYLRNGFVEDGSRRTLVFFLDTGFSYEGNPMVSELQSSGRLNGAQLWNFCTCGECGEYPEDLHGHGTKVAALGMAYMDDARIQAGILKLDCTMSISSPIEAFDHINSLVESAPDTSIVLNMSIALHQDKLMDSYLRQGYSEEEAIERGRNFFGWFYTTYFIPFEGYQGVVIVASAPNRGPNQAWLTFPTAYPGVISVVRRDMHDGWEDEHQAMVRVPNVFVTTDLEGSLFTSRGHSYGAAVVSAFVAHVLQLDPNFYPYELIIMMQQEDYESGVIHLMEMLHETPVYEGVDTVVLDFMTTARLTTIFSALTDLVQGDVAGGLRKLRVETEYMAAKNADVGPQLQQGLVVLQNHLHEGGDVRDALEEFLELLMEANRTLPETTTLMHTPRHTLEGHDGWVNSVAFSPDGTRVASGSNDHTVKLWNTETGRIVRTLTGHTDMVESVAFSPDGALLASGSRDKTVRIWRVATGTRVRTLEYLNSVYAVAFSPDGRMLAVGSWKTITLWDTSTWREIRTIEAHDDWVFSLAFNAVGTRLASASGDHTVKLWNPATGRIVRTLTGHTDRVRTVAFSPDGNRLASGGDDSTVRIWNASTGRLVQTLEHTHDQYDVHIYAVAFSPEGTVLASVGWNVSGVRLWDTRTWAPLTTLRGHTDTIHAVSFTRDGRTLASGSFDDTIMLWDMEAISGR